MITFRQADGIKFHRYESGGKFCVNGHLVKDGKSIGLIVLFAATSDLLDSVIDAAEKLEYGDYYHNVMTGTSSPVSVTQELTTPLRIVEHDPRAQADMVIYASDLRIRIEQLGDPANQECPT